MAKIGKMLDIITIICAAFVTISLLVAEPLGYGSFKYAWAKYFFILFSVFAAILSWMDLKGKFRSRNLRLATRFYNQGLVFNAKGDLDAAISNYKMALNMDPDFVLAHTALGHAFFLKGKLNKSIKEFRKATEIDPTFGSAHCSLGAALGEVGKMEEAIAEFKKAIDLEPDNVTAREGFESALEAANQNSLEFEYTEKSEGGIYSNISKRMNMLDNLLLLCFFLILLFLNHIGNSLWPLLALVGAMAYAMKVIMEGIFTLGVKYPFITYYPLAALLFFAYVLLCSIFKYPLQAIILVIVIFFSIVSLMLIKPNITMLKRNLDALSRLSHKKLILLIVFGVIGTLTGATIFMTITIIIEDISWPYSMISGVLGGIGVGIGAKFGEFKPTKALKLLGIAMGISSVLIGYYFVYKWIDISTFTAIGLKGLFSFKEFMGTDSLDTLLAFFFGGLFWGYMGIDFSTRFLADEKLESITAIHS